MSATEVVSEAKGCAMRITTANQNAILPETAFLDCENVPSEMAECFDKPWYFVGEVTGVRPHLQYICNRCSARRMPSLFDVNALTDYEPIHVVAMRGHRFITDDMLEVVVYFGVCEHCGRVHWARQGPPFKRARRLVTEFTTTKGVM